MLRAAMKHTSTSLAEMSVVIVNVEMDIPDWRGIRKKLDERRRSQDPIRLRQAKPG